MIRDLLLQDDQLDLLAGHIVTNHYKKNPSLALVHGEQGRAKCHEDAIYHLTYLAQSLQSGSDVLFKDYVIWAKGLLLGLNIPESHLSEHLEVMRETLKDLLIEAQALEADRIIVAAKAAMADAPSEPETFLKDDNPLISLATDYLTSLLEAKRSDACALIMDAVKNKGLDIQSIYLNVFQVCQREIGRLWQTGKISVAQEHFCTAVTQLCMSQLYPFIFSEKKNGKKAVVACSNGELHEVGVRMVADLLEMNGWDSYYLGANVPQNSVVAFIEEHRPNLVGISATITSHVENIRQLIVKIREAESTHQHDPSYIMVGGYPFNLDNNIWRSTGADCMAIDACQALVKAAEIV